MTENFKITRRVTTALTARSHPGEAQVARTGNLYSALTCHLLKTLILLNSPIAEENNGAALTRCKFQLCNR